jgi:transcriptional regulator with XRE-family HTH domain
MSSDPQALLTVLLAMTGLTQTEAAALVGVASRTVRRWMEGVRKPPAVAIDRLAALARAQGQVADSMVRALGEAGSAPKILLVYRRNQDVPPWSGWRTAGCHLALVRRIAERRPDVQFVTYYRGAYRRWLGSRADSEALRTDWAASRLSPSRSCSISG